MIDLKRIKCYAVTNLSDGKITQEKFMPGGGKVTVTGAYQPDGHDEGIKKLSAYLLKCGQRVKD